MRYAKLGKTGLEVSAITLGCMSFGEPGGRGRPWTLDEAACREIVRQALGAGINVFDTANVYSAGRSEEITGQALKDFVPRDEVVLATKVFMPMRPGPNSTGLSRKAIFAELEASLRRLQTDYIDLYQIHRWDYGTPIEETLEALHDAVKSGKVRYIGASSMHAWQFTKALYLADLHGWTRFVSMQNHYNLIYREEEREMIPQCLDQGIGVIPWSPLARGMLAGSKTRDGARNTTRAGTDPLVDSLYSESDFDVVDAVAEVAAERGVPPAQIALAWLLHRPGVTAPIVGATRARHVEDALAAVKLELTEDEMRRLEERYVPHPVVGHG
jgi:1-deoxyxylulose-5-phosphate synthase